MQCKVAEEFALKIRVYMEAMYYMKPTETSNWAKYPLLLVSCVAARSLRHACDACEFSIVYQVMDAASFCLRRKQ